MMFDELHRFHKLMSAPRNTPRGQYGHFRRLPPIEIRDDEGRRMVSIDLHEVERRLKARSVTKENHISKPF